MRTVTLQNDSLMPVGWRARPRSFVALMGLYESNHIRLAGLAGDLRELPSRSCSIVAGDCELVLTVTDRTPYTTGLNLTYWLEGAGPGGRDAVPDMLVKVYHDARVVECTGFAGGGRSPVERELDQRWARNVMLNKWLEYCADRGHRFATR
ncbi:MAG: DUF1249 domain-containing protein [Steroidobacteraceae bacterium]